MFIKGFAPKFARKSVCPSCVNGALAGKMKRTIRGEYSQGQNVDLWWALALTLAWNRQEVTFAVYFSLAIVQHSSICSTSFQGNSKLENFWMIPVLSSPKIHFWHLTCQCGSDKPLRSKQRSSLKLWPKNSEISKTLDLPCGIHIAWQSTQRNRKFETGVNQFSRGSVT